MAFDGEHYSDITLLASGIELLILAFDIFDDIEDEDNLDKEWMKIDQSISLNAATSLYSISLQVICELKTNSDFPRLAMKYALNAMQGQHNDLENFPKLKTNVFK